LRASKKASSADELDRLATLTIGGYLQLAVDNERDDSYAQYYMKVLENAKPSSEEECLALQGRFAFPGL
jgi:hypothetical protein